MRYRARFYRLHCARLDKKKELCNLLRADQSKPQPETFDLTNHFLGEKPRKTMSLEAEADFLGLSRWQFARDLLDIGVLTHIASRLMLAISVM